MLPEKARYGITWRRIRKALASPAVLFQNLKFWWNEDVSEEEHFFVMGPPRSGTTLVKNVLESRGKRSFFSVRIICISGGQVSKMNE
jgi:hypothetical protein